MNFFHAVALALVQGLTEFLPISSSAHLILLPRLMHWVDQGLAFDVSVHVGTLTAVLVYFRRDVMAMAGGWFHSVTHRELTPDGRLAWAVLWGTVPVGLAGILLQHIVEDQLRSPMVIATTTILFGVVLWWADARHTGERDEHTLTWRDVLLIGVAQAIALIPGTSRSGITMTAGLMAGLSRTAAARYSFLLSIPVIVLAGGLEGVELLENPAPVHWGAMALGWGVSAISAYLVIHFFLEFISRATMMPFAVYRIFLGIALFALFLV